MPGNKLWVSLGQLLRRTAGRLGQARRIRRRRRNDLHLLNASGLFDRDWYLATYPDVALARVDPARHFLESGWREGRNPSAGFCTAGYLRLHHDVAELGINPLLHFIEHGSFEGREIEGVGEQLITGRGIAPSPADLPPAFPVYSGKMAPHRTISWQRACNLAVEPNSIGLNGLGLALAPSFAERSALAAVLDDFAALSGASDRLLEKAFNVGRVARVADIWFASGNRAVSRWEVDRPTVMRAVQMDPATEQLTLVGEGLVISPMDTVEFDLASATLPILLLAVDPQGELRGTTILAFPSLARGGAHYAELIDASGGAPHVDIFATSKQLEARLRKIRCGKAEPVVRKLVIDLAGADGTGPLFRHDVRELLERVLLIDIGVADDHYPTAGSNWLATTATLTAKQRLRRHGSNLMVGADMLPSLGMLAAIEGEVGPASNGTAVGLIVCDKDPAQPAVRFDAAALPETGRQFRSSYCPLPFPRLDNSGQQTCPAALRTVARRLDDAEYLYPDLSAEPDPEAANLSVDWLVDWNESDEELLAQSLTAIGFQQDIGRQRICFLTKPSSLARRVASAEFAEPWTAHDDLESALAASNADLVGYLGAGVILHDARVAGILASMLLNSKLASASCALVVSARHGRSWRPRLVDAGAIPVDRHVVFGGSVSQPAEMLWRAVYPVTAPPQKFWMTRTAEARRWHGGEAACSPLHLLTSRVTASLEPSSGGVRMPFVPPQDPSRSIRARVLVG